MPYNPVVTVVDDDRQVLAALAELLRVSGLSCRTFSSGAQFLEAVAPEDCGCIVLDLFMPDISGIGVLKQLRARAVGMPVIVLTGYGGVASCKEAIRGGVFDYIEKPVEPKTLLERVARAIRWDARRVHMRRRISTLTEREQQVMQGILKCYSVKRIAHELGVSFQTAARHRARLFQKLDVDSDAELISTLTWLTTPPFVSQETGYDGPYARADLSL